MEYYSAIKKNEILSFATIWMDLEDIMLSEITQEKKDKYCMISIVCGIFKKEKNIRYRKQTGGCQRQGLGDGKMEGFKMYKFPVTK